MTEAAYRAWVRSELFEQAPLSIAVIDRDYRVVETNRNFEALFGPGRDRKCYEAYKDRTSPCTRCMAAEAFADGRVHVDEEVGVDREGRTAWYLVHVAPIRAEDGSIPYVVEMSTDVTETKRLKLEYQTLFEQVPCYVTVLNRDLRVVRANERFREKFGELSGRCCFEMFKRRTEACESCPAKETFADGKIHTAEQIGVGKDGRRTHYIVTTAPASRREGGFSHVIEMAIDVTAQREVEDELRRAHALREALVEHSLDGIVGTGPEDRVLLMNPAAEALTGRKAADVLGRLLPEDLLPLEFRELLALRQGEVVFEETTIRSSTGEEVPVRLSGHAFAKGDEYLGAAAFLQDLRRVRRLEQEKIEAERLAAVGQTVAGLAHGIKNILTGLEGGMYFLRSGMEGGRPERLDEGWLMLKRNMEKISTLVRNLLSFSKGRTPKVEVRDPAVLVAVVVELYREAAARERVTVVAEVPERVRPAALDSEGMHSALANLVSNAIDACQMSGRESCRVVVRAKDEMDALVFEVEDEGCGMDQEVRKLAFTNFFTTKGTGGTGLGLLLTRKITQEHGGRIALETAPGQGTVFRLIFPRDRLPKPGGEEAKP